MNRNASFVLFLGFALASLAVLPVLYDDASALRHESRALSARPGTLEKRNTNAFARILGELRIGAADFLFVKTELYLHGGIGYAPHSDNLDEAVDVPHETHRDETAHDAHDAHDTRDDHDDHTRHDHGSTDHEPSAGVQMRMRSAEEDFRGIIGDLEREIKPWRDPEAPHVLVGGAELLPWFRLMTITNPHFIRGYRIGAMWLGREDKHDEALEYLDEGIARNPENPELFRLYLSKVLLLTHKAREEGQSAWKRALDAAQSGLELGYRVRPEDGETGTIHEGLLWNEDLEEDLLFLTRFEVTLLDRLGRKDEALNAAKRHRRAFPQDGVLERLETNLATGEADADSAGATQAPPP